MPCLASGLHELDEFLLELVGRPARTWTPHTPGHTRIMIARIFLNRSTTRRRERRRNARGRTEGVVAPARAGDPAARPRVRAHSPPPCLVVVEA
jgi:hypothetical protein